MESCDAEALETLDPCRSSLTSRSTVVRACAIACAWESIRGWLRMLAVKAITAAPITTIARAEATSNSTSVNPAASLRVSRRTAGIIGIGAQQPEFGGEAGAAAQ